MNFITEKNRIYIKNNKNKIVAEIEYKEVENGVFDIYHTFVDESLRGMGIASLLVKEAVANIKAKNGKVIATCPFAKKWLEDNNIEISTKSR